MSASEPVRVSRCKGVSASHGGLTSAAPGARRYSHDGCGSPSSARFRIARRAYTRRSCRVAVVHYGVALPRRFRIGRKGDVYDDLEPETIG